MPFCNVCGAQITEEAAFCGRCGNAVASSPSPRIAPTAAMPESPRPRYRYLLWAAAGFLVLIVMMGLIIAAGDKNTRRNSDLAAIEAVRQQNSDLVAAMTAASRELKENGDDDLDKGGALIKSYVAAARQIDTHSCPRDFAESYQRNLSAWSDEADAVLAHPHIPSTQGEAFVEGFLRGWLYGDISGGQDEINEWRRQVRAKHDEVTRTQSEVDALAARYR
jgi:hypothetical protein